MNMNIIIDLIESITLRKENFTVRPTLEYQLFNNITLEKKKKKKKP